MPYALDDTICAVASPPGRAARGIVRLSGPHVRPIVARCVHPRRDVWPGDDRPAVVAAQVIVPGLPPWLADCYLWPERRSYTGQASCELHTLGSPPLLEALVRQLVASGARIAQPGEFTLRAFLEGRIDLTRAEAVLGVIDAAGRAELDVALQQLAGGIGRPLRAVRDDLVDLAVLLEAALDFPDEELPPFEAETTARRLAAARESVDALAEQMTSRRSASERPRVVLVGWTNTGKSSLFNALLGAGHAIVSQEPGTTRDYLSAGVTLDGVAVELVDTAGAENHDGPTPTALRRSADGHACTERDRADLQVLCIDGSREPNAWEWDELQKEIGERLVVLTKSDLPRRFSRATDAIAVSSHTGEGLAALEEAVSRRLASRGATSAGVVSATAIRCRGMLQRATEALASAGEAHRLGLGEELVAVDVRVALDALGEVLGTVYTDDLLDRIFQQFCIGK